MPYPNDDRDELNPNEMDAEDWAGFYGDCERRTGLSAEEYMDFDQSMNY